MRAWQEKPTRIAANINIGSYTLMSDNLKALRLLVYDQRKITFLYYLFSQSAIAVFRASTRF